MALADWNKNVITLTPYGGGWWMVCFGDLPPTDLSRIDTNPHLSVSADLSSALAQLAVQMARSAWECSPEPIPFREKGQFLLEGRVVISFKGGDDGWVAEYWPEGKQDDTLVASHVFRPEVAVITVALMAANPQLYESAS